jgi:hypothetical protein
MEQRAKGIGQQLKTINDLNDQNHPNHPRQRGWCADYRVKVTQG